VIGFKTHADFAHRVLNFCGSSFSAEHKWQCNFQMSYIVYRYAKWFVFVKDMMLEHNRLIEK